MGSKHCGRRKNCSLRAISLFPTVFSKGLFPGASKGVAVWEWVKNGTEWKPMQQDQDQYSSTILKDILCLFLQDFQIGM